MGGRGNVAAAGATPETTGRTWIALTGVIAAVTVFAVAQGLSYPLFTLLMQKQGHSPATIGLSAAMMPIGLVCSAALVPMLVRRMGARNLAVGSAGIAAICFITIGWIQDFVAWFPLRFLIGFVVNPLYILGEVWMLALSPPERRGRLMGVFNAVTGAGYALGPISLALVGTDGWAPFVIGAVGFMGCALLLAFAAGSMGGLGKDGGPTTGLWAFWGLAPALLVAVIVSAATQQSVYSLLPVFGTAYGLAEPIVAALVTALSIGNIFLQVPLGFGAERIGARSMMIGCSCATLVCALVLPLVMAMPLMWPVLVVMGGVGYGVYTMSLVELGNRFTGQALVAGNAAFGLMWGLGGILGPPGSGFAMQALGPSGLPLVIAGLSMVLILFAALRAFRRR